MNDTEIVSKVLVHENSDDARQQLKEFFAVKGLVGLKDNTQDIIELLNANTDLGAVFLSAECDYNGESGLEVGRRIHKARPELPLFIRKPQLSDEDVETPEFGLYYTLRDLGRLDYLIDEHLFTRFYPMQLIRGIQEISFDAFSSTISDVNVVCDQPYLVKDQIIYGELFSLIPLESNWCRGYMMLQTTEKEMLDVIGASKTHLPPDCTNFRDVNSLLNEVTNLVWGGIKSRFFAEADTESANRTQVPTLVNHKEKYISFGTTEPQLCFRYTISDKQSNAPSIVVYQKIIFNLDWRPEAFKESDQAVDDLVDSGELELF